MGAPDTGLQAGEQPAAETLLTAFKTIDDAERAKHASVLNYWLSIRGSKEFPPLHDFDPLEISDFGASSVLVELLGGGHDAEIRHLGEALKADGVFERIIDAPSPSILSSIARKLPIVAISREFLAFEDDFSAADASKRCWVTLLPLSSSGAWVDYVYAFVSVGAVPEEAAAAAEVPAEDVPAADVTEDEVAVDDAPADEAQDIAETAEDIVQVEAEQPGETPDETAEPVETAETVDQQEPEEPADVAAAKTGPGFAKLFEGFAGLTGFYGQAVKAEPAMQAEPPSSEPPAIEPPAVELEAVDEPVVEPPAVEPVAVDEPAFEAATPEPEAVDEPVVDEATPEPVAVEEPPVEPPAIDPPAAIFTEQPTPASEGSMQSKLADVRARADEARAAKLKANMALYEGLGAAYDFALDAEDSPEEYLRLVEAQGLKIQLRSPMAPVVKLAFGGLCDDGIIAELEAVLAWALKQELPRGTLAARINEAGGIGGVLNGESRAA